MKLSDDAAAIRSLLDSFVADALVQARMFENVNGPAPSFDKERFWYVLLGCLLTTQQRSTRGMPVPRFLDQEPFPLSLEACRQHEDVEQFVLRTLTAYGGIRRTSTIAHQSKQNYEWLESGGWCKIQEIFGVLTVQRQREPRDGDKVAERQAARCIDQFFAGIGPKQSRNLLQWLGLTRYEVPLDSRVCDWINASLSFEVNVAMLGDIRYYEQTLDRLQAACAEAEVLPCMFDAAAFNDENKAFSTQAKPQLSEGTQPKGSTASGYVNKNGQVTIRDTGVPGTDHFQRVYQIACSHCGQVYGANGSDIHERKCPGCQGGVEGLPLKVAHHA